jgi:hypothetical protein
MSGGIFREGGPLNVRRAGPELYEMSVPLPLDEQGMLGRECHAPDCTPAFFKVKPGTGLKGQTVAYCPYCRAPADPSAFLTAGQREYATQLTYNEAVPGINDSVRSAFGMDGFNRREIGGGMISIEMTFEPLSVRPVGRPFEERLRRDLTCPGCGLMHAVFGLAAWCPDCGQDVFLDHVSTELEVIRHVLAGVGSHTGAYGARLASRDVENALEDLVSVFEAVLKTICRRHLLASGASPMAADDVVAKDIRNRFQNVKSGAGAFREITGLELFDALDLSRHRSLQRAFEKRHPIAHNLGIVDRKYMARGQSGEREGREIALTAEEVREATNIAEGVLTSAHSRVAGSHVPQSSP